MLKIKQEGNYLAQIVKLGKPIPHPNADRLVGWILNHEIVYTDLSYKEGDVCVLFPIGSKINEKLLSYLNCFRNSQKNRDAEVKGYFEDTCRVRAQPLRGQPSNGVLFRVFDIENWLEEETGKPVGFSIQSTFNDVIGKEFDSFNDIIICEKYIVKDNTKQSLGKTVRAAKDKQELIIDNQFRLHYDTTHLKKSIHQFVPEDYVVITYKLHGTSGISANVLTKRKLNVIEKLLSKFINIKKEEYSLINSSRKVIKLVGDVEEKVNGYYNTNIHIAAHKTLVDAIEPGITLYYEIVGYCGDGYIQKHYDYGCNVGEFKSYMYRITYTTPQGKVIEFSWSQVEDYCNKYGLNIVPVLYKGQLKNIIPNKYKELSNWSDKLYEELVKQYTDKDCFMCKSKMPEEGICIRNESSHTTLFKAFKLKSFRFLQIESAEMDAGESNIEDV